MRPILLAVLCLGASPLAAHAQSLSTLECATYRTVLTAAGESVKGLATVARETDLSGLRAKVDEDTRKAIARLEDANTNLQPVMAEWSAAATDLAERIRVACSR